MKLPIYLDNHATTPLDPRVLDAMMPYLTETYGNAASHSHGFGWAAEQAVETARAQVAQLIGATAKEIVFTSGATESNNLALKGVVEMARQTQPEQTPHVITQATEHKAVLDPCAWLGRQGCRVTVLPAGRDGLIDLDKLRAALDEAPALLVSIMAANNEVGTVQPVEEIGALCRERGVLFHTDAAQAAGKVPVDVAQAKIDLLSISGHKIYGPKGVGALYVRRGVKAAEQMHGGGHEHAMRSGTLNVAGIVGLGAACALAAAEMESESARLTALRERLRTKLQAGLERVRVNGADGTHGSRRLPGNLSVTFEGVDSESLMMGIRDVAVSSGSACTSASIQASHVLRALGLSDEDAHSTLRFGIGRFNTEEEIDFVAERLLETVPKLRELSPAWADAT
jgi:cysteine desulfurase